jgi:hypothetical protein
MYMASDFALSIVYICDFLVKNICQTAENSTSPAALGNATQLSYLCRIAQGGQGNGTTRIRHQCWKTAILSCQ